MRTHKVEQLMIATVGLLLVLSDVVFDRGVQSEHRRALSSEHQGARPARKLRDLDGADRPR